MPNKYDIQAPRYSSANGYYKGYRTGSSTQNNVAQIAQAAPSMAKIGNDQVTCRASIDLNNLPRGMCSSSIICKPIHRTDN